MKWAQLANLEEAATAVLTLTEGLEAEEFLRSRLTRREVHRYLLDIDTILTSFGAETRAKLPELDWHGWSVTASRIQCGGKVADTALWFAVQSLTPATLMWLRLYRTRQPELFKFTL